MIRTVVDAISKTFGYGFVSLYILDGRILRLQHQVGYDPDHAFETIPVDSGISGRVVRTGQPALIKDIRQDPDVLIASPYISSEICVPLFDGNLIFGTFNIESSQEVPLLEEDLRLMIIVSEQVNTAIRRARLYADRTESLRRKQHINTFAHTINSTLDLPNILELVTKPSFEMVEAETGTVSIMSDDGKEMINSYDFNESSSLNSIIPRGQGLTWLTYETGKPIILDEYSQRDMWLSNLLPFQLFAQSMLVASGVFFVLNLFVNFPVDLTALLAVLFPASIVVNLLMTFAGKLNSFSTDTAMLASREMTNGKFRNHYWWGGITLGHVVPLVMFFAFNALAPVAVVCSVIGLFFYEYALVMAPQYIPNS